MNHRLVQIRREHLQRRLVVHTRLESRKQRAVSSSRQSLWQRRPFNYQTKRKEHRNVVGCHHVCRVPLTSPFGRVSDRDPLLKAQQTHTQQTLGNVSLTCKATNLSSDLKSVRNESKYQLCFVRPICGRGIILHQSRTVTFCAFCRQK